MTSLHMWLDDEQRWADVPGVDRVDFEHIKVIHMSPPIPMPEWLRIDLGLPEPDPEPTPIERALAILQPHLDDEPLYQPPTA
ncbi:hypothetical protein QMZ92_16505 [Streptomyces sp. HNM0645]|uniref:hypothetical protein n=1 Tax=Streptomyces sp. HNM0645 TaxID=2782343 RepID=UPI0024B6530F|nr:hypothetical protein [Streptomyces sp. HNM0645]MDI9885937.1 hypothetical protein [Streptomyces sp. HNM0645]